MDPEVLDIDEAELQEEVLAGLYSGTGEPRDVEIPPAPPWRRFTGQVEQEREIDPDPFHETTFVCMPGVRRAVNAALLLRRPLLLTGRPGSGKSSLIESVARELRLGPALRWHVTSRSTLQDALYRYDAIGRLHASQLSGDDEPPPISDFLRLGPLGTALLPTTHPRALLIDEIDKSDIDLPNDLLNVFERGEFEIPELARLAAEKPDGRTRTTTVHVREHGGDATFPVHNGRVACAEFPFVVLTSNGERDFPAPFLRRCIRYRMPDPTPSLLARILARHLEQPAADAAADLIQEFAARAEQSRAHATDQLMNAVFTVTQYPEMPDAEREKVVELLTKALTSDLV